MSRIGKNPITIPAGVTVELNNSVVTVKGKLGQLSQEVTDVTVKVGVKAGESGKIFGSVTNIQLADALKKAGYEVERKNIEMNEDAIKALGTYSAKVRLFKEISATINFEVIAE